MDKVTIDIKGNKAIVTEGEDTFIGKLIAAGGGKLKIHTARVKGEFQVVKKPKKEK